MKRAETQFNNMWFNGQGGDRLKCRTYDKRTEFTAIIEDDELLKLSKAINERLGKLSGVKYETAVIVDGKVVKWL